MEKYKIEKFTWKSIEERSSLPDWPHIQVTEINNLFWKQGEI